MSKAGSAAKVKLSSYDDLFGNAEEKTGSEEQIIRAKLTDLHEFRNHPFRVRRKVVFQSAPSIAAAS